MNKTIFTKSIYVFLSLLLALGAFAALPGGVVSAATLDVCTGGTCAYTTIQAAINAAAPGDTVYVHAGTYYEALSITKMISLVGEGRDLVIIETDNSAGTSYGVSVRADGVVISDLTVVGPNNYTGGTRPGNYGIKVSKVDDVTDTSFTITNVKIRDSYRSNLDLNGITSGLIDGVIVENAVYGAGIGISDSSNITVQNITTIGNAWGGLAVMAGGNWYPPGGSYNVTLTGTNSFSETNKVYTENEADPTKPVVNFTADGFGFIVRNPIRPYHTWYQITEADAGSFALGFTNPEDSVIQRLSDGVFITADGMSIQAAIDAAADGDTVFVEDGTYNEYLRINKPLTLSGESKAGVIIDPQSLGGYGIAATADGLVFENFTLQNAQTYGLKISGSTGVVVQNVVVQGSGNTNVDLNGVINATLDAVEAYNANSGNGFSITDSNNITVSNSISEGNHFTTFSAGVMVAASGAAYPGGSDNVVFVNNDFRETTHIYTERSALYQITNLDPGNYDYVLKTSLGLSEYYYVSFAEAKAAAVLYAQAFLAGDMSSFSIKSVSLATFYVDTDLKIQTAVNAAEAGETVQVAAGTYVEDVVIDKALNVLGPNAGINPNTDTRNPEAVILLEVPGDEVDDTLMWYLEADGITIDGFLFDGDNPALTSGLDVRGADVDAGSGIVSYEGIGSLRIENNILKNFSYAAIQMYNYYNSGTPTSGNYIQNNWIDNLYTESWGMGILIYNSFYVDIQDNVITRSRVGIQTGNYQGPNPGSTASIKNNDIEATRLGLFYNLMSGTSTPFEVANNNFVALPHTNSQSGILISSINVAVQTNFQNNNITGFDYGINFWNDPTSNFVTVNGGVIDQCDYGVFANNYDGYNSNANSSVVQIQDVTIQNSTKAAVYVKDNDLNSNAATIKLNVLSGNQLLNNPVDFLIKGLDATMTLDETLTGPFVWNIDGALIQPALDETYAGDTFVILAGEYEQNFTVNKYLKIYGEGSGDDPAEDTILRKMTNVAVVAINSSGLSEIEPLLMQDLRIEPVGVYGLNLGNLAYLKLDNVKVIGSADTDFNENESCLKVATTADVKYLNVVNSAFDGCDYGWYVAKAVTADDSSNLQYVNVENTTFDNNDYKGLYIEKLSDTVFENVSISDNGSTGFWNNDWNAGIDVNLKNGDYQNLTFSNIIVDGNGLGYKEGTGLLVKARDDGATYGAFPATLDNVLITNSTFTGNERGIRLGEPGKLNAGPTNVVINFNRILGNEQTYTGTDGSAYGGLVNQSVAAVNAENNWFGCNAGPGATGCDAVAVGTGAGAVDADPWIVLSLTADPAVLEPGMSAAVEANLVMNSDGVSTATDGYIPQGLLVTFTAPDGGTLNPTSGLTVNSAVSTTFTSPEIHGDYRVCAEVDNEQFCPIVPVVGPGAVDDAYSTPEDTTLVVAAPGVLTNDTGIETLPYAVALVGRPLHGQLTLNADGSFTYIPDAGFVGEDTFEYQVVTHPNDAKTGWSDEALVTITVTPVNKVPVAVADAYDAVQNVTLVKTAAEGVLVNDTDADVDDSLEAVLVNDVSNGTLTLNADGSFTYVPDVNYVGFDSFTYYATDGEANSAPVTVTITVVPGVPVTGDPILIYLPFIVR